MATLIDFNEVNIVFGNDPEKALPLMDAGMSREEIQVQTDQILGVHNASLKVDEGEIVVLMGLSGSGKSTLLRAVNGLNPVMRGEMRVFDGEQMLDVAQADRRQIRKLRRERVSMVFQKFGLLPWRSVLENVALGPEIEGQPVAQRLARARTALDVVNLSEWAENDVSELSGGMQQRVGLARAFATDAPLLLMDEPFSALDPLIRAKLQDDLLSLQARTGRTILFVSHDLQEAMKIGNRIAILEGGRIIQVGTPEDIILNPAGEYVADFVANINPLPVLTARDCLSSAPADPGAPVVSAHQRITDIGPALSGTQRAAVEENGVVIGSLCAGDVLARLMSAAT